MIHILKIVVAFIAISIILLVTSKNIQHHKKESFQNKYLRKDSNSTITGSQKEGFVSNQCPTTMIKKGNQILLYNPKLAMVPGVNPIVLKSLEDYKHYVKWQRASKINCPILHLERVYNSQGDENYEIRQSFLLDQPIGPLNHELPVLHKTPDINKILDAGKDNNAIYNTNQYPSFDPYNQHVGIITKLEQ